MIQSCVKETGTPVVSFRGDAKELKEDLIRILYTMATKDSSSHKAMIEACREVDMMLMRDWKYKVTEVTDES